MFKKVLVANRGEVAVRIIRTLREMGIQSVAVYSDIDRYALHTQLADEAICIGPAAGLDSYANEVAIITAALATGVDAIHPGYGFLSEKHEFVSLCKQVGITFIGPSDSIIRSMGNKDLARQTMHQVGVPIIPGSQGLIYSLDEAQQVAEDIGYPLMIKASSGGGGTGMRRVEEPEQLERMFNQAQRESQSAYGNADLYLEKIIKPARHIEVQLLADSFGNVIHLGERDCSIQRNHQKLIEITPAINLPEKVRQDLCQTAVRAAKAIGYENAGTIEFLVDDQNQFYFMEMNTRLQVEHTISEMITDIDIVREQILIASGHRLSYQQDEINFSGVSIEARLMAEDVYNNFNPQAGRVNTFIIPTGGLGLRTETSLYAGAEITPFYDPMIAKIISYGKDSQEAFERMLRGLYEVEVSDVQTNKDLLEALCQNENVQTGQTDTNWFNKSFYDDWLIDYKQINKGDEEGDRGVV